MSPILFLVLVFFVSIGNIIILGMCISYINKKIRLSNILKKKNKNFKEELKKKEN